MIKPFSTLHPLSKATRRVLFLATFLLAGVWTLQSRPAVGSTTAGRIPAPQVGFLAPSFVLTGQDGQTVNLSDYRGQVVILNFWASWCPPCRAEMPAIEQVYQSYQSRGLVVLAVDAAYQDAPDKMQSFLGSFVHSYLILRDEDGVVNQRYTVSSLPTTFFIDRDGIIRDMVVGGPLTYAGLFSRVENLLQETP